MKVASSQGLLLFSGPIAASNSDRPNYFLGRLLLERDIFLPPSSRNSKHAFVTSQRRLNRLSTDLVIPWSKKQLHVANFGLSRNGQILLDRPPKGEFFAQPLRLTLKISF